MRQRSALVARGEGGKRGGGGNFVVYFVDVAEGGIQ